MSVPDELMRIVDQAAGREHSANGEVMACLADVVATVRADERGKVAEEARDAAEQLGGNPSLRGDAATLMWFADKITAGEP